MTCFQTKIGRIQRFETGIKIYTDDSKDKNKVTAAAVINKEVFSARLPDEATIFSAESMAIEPAFEHLRCINIL